MVRMDLTDNLGHLANTEQMVKTAKLAIQVSWDLVELLELAALEDKMEQVQFVYPEMSNISSRKCCCFLSF
jgi:hypothetical protein